MATFNINSLSAFIGQHFTSFEGHSCSCGCANVRVFDTLMRAADFLRKEPAAKSVNFTALPNNGRSKPVTLVVTQLEPDVSSDRAFSLEIVTD